MTKNLWHALSLPKVISLLKTDKAGLAAQEAQKRLNKNGKNKLPEERKISGLIIFLNQFKSPLVYVLLAAAVISLILQDIIDASVILVGVLLNTILGFYQEYKANRAIFYLRRLIDLSARVLRDGQIYQISASELVPGDIINLAPGEKIPADCRLIITSNNFQTIEATLTGESSPSRKNIAELPKGTSLADRKNMVYSGTTVASGKATAVVCATGVNTEIGQITKLIQETKDEKTPLQKQLAQFSKTLTYAVLIICTLVVIIGKIQGRAILGFGDAARDSMLNMAAALAVAAIPEGLLISVTAILAIGMQAILKQKALVRKLIAAETLGSVSIICTDKTGTLTEGKMQVSHIITFDNEIPIHQSKTFDQAEILKDHDLILKISVLCNDAIIENPQDELEEWKIIGDPTENALLLAAIQSGIPYQEIKNAQPRLAEIPFNSELKYMATLNKLDHARNVLYVKGAPEKILMMANQIRIDGKKNDLSSQYLERLKDKYEKLTAEGLRLLAFGYKQIDDKKEINLTSELNSLIFIGFIALKDPIRPEAKEMFKLASLAGVRSVIVTGDHKLTAKAVLAELGGRVKDQNILEGWQLDRISDEELNKKIYDINIFARVEPKHKLRIVQAWQNRGEVVAMTGDGVNDAPALKLADIGIALGSGTDVAKETSDLILLDDNFKTIVLAVERGRIIFENIRKSILYLLADSFSEIILISGALLLFLPLPVLPAQIIWVNLIDDGLPSIAMIFEPGEKNVMKEKPRKKKEKILNSEMKFLIFAIGIFTDLILLTFFYVLLNFSDYSITHIRTFIFTALGIDSLFYAFSCKSFRSTIFQQSLLTNKLLIVGVAFGTAMQLTAVYEPHLQRIFQTVPLHIFDWLLLIAFALFKVCLVEITKYYFIVKKKFSYAK